MPGSLRLIGAALAAAALAVLALATAVPAQAAVPAPLPAWLSQTGLFEPGAPARLRAGVQAYSPQYALWSDGADKRRWLWLPPGRAIDARDADAWVFPVGTRLWKEFSFGGRAVETRYIERAADGSWRYATYVWAADGSDARLAPAAGISALPVAAAPDGRYSVPARADCLACHGDAPVPVLGVSALQLSPDRDPLAAHGRPAQPDEADLRSLVARGSLRGLPPALLAQAPRIAASTPQERAALGYLHANCGHCHHRAGTQAPVALTLAQSVTDAPGSLVAIKASTLSAPSRYTPPGAGAPARVVVAGDAEASVLALRMRSRLPQVQMPPVGTRVPDPEGLALVQRWIQHDLSQPKESLP